MKKEKNQNLDKQVAIRMSESMYDQLLTHAKKNNRRHVSDFIREILIKSLKMK